MSPHLEDAAVSRTIRSFLPLVGDPVSLATAFDGDAMRWLPGARRDGPDAYVMAVRAGSLTRSVRAQVGAPWRAGATRWRSLRWDPVAEDGDPATIDRLLPGLDGELGLHLESAGRVTLLLDARYRPPGGSLGVAVDSIGLHRVALATVERCLEDIAARLAAEALLLDDGSTLDDDPSGAEAAPRVAQV